MKIDEMGGNIQCNSQHLNDPKKTPNKLSKNTWKAWSAR